MTFAVGSLVRARGREWVVLPDSDDEVLLLRPLGGTGAETTGLLVGLESVSEATFAPPDPAYPGDDRSARLLREALRLGFRSSAGPFRSFGAIAVEPRPYQLVPLLMALRQDPVRLLVADDVGIGKTIEAALIAKELLEQGDASRLAVLCPPHLAEQWQAELAAKFHIDAEVVLSSTAARLERGLPVNRTIFDVHPHVIVSTDYIKSDRRRADFVRTCPELVIVDEAHTCAVDDDGRNRGRQQRHQLIAELAADTTRHLILVTATPHSGKEGAFRSLLRLVEPSLAQLPEDLSGDANRRNRERLAAHLVQRKRGDIKDFLGDTRFPERVESEHTYRLTPEYRDLFDKVLAFARERVRDPAGGDRRRQRVRWWSALALLRTMASSPAAAAETMRTRAASGDTTSVEEADEVGQRMVFDTGDNSDAETSDVVHGAVDESESDDELDDAKRTRRRLRDLAAAAEKLKGDSDQKLVDGAPLVRGLVRDGFRPIVFCRFIRTADYVAEELRRRLPKGTEVMAVTGSLAPAEREQRIAALATHERRVLVATDCLSEGINLQDHFDAVVHWDLPWNPTRLEQREGRVDRFGQVAPSIRIETLYGADNQIDEIVLRVLLRKHRAIRKRLGVSIPVPGDENEVMAAVAENLLLTEAGSIVDQQALPGMEEWLRPRTQDLQDAWDRASDRERVSRSLFAQHGINVTEVAREVDAVRHAIGSGADVEAFIRSAIPAHGGLVRDRQAGVVELDLSEVPVALRDALGGAERIAGRFEVPVGEGETHLSRTHPTVAGLAAHVLDSALDPLVPGVARRCGALRTTAVEAATTLLLVRYRFHIVATRTGEERAMLAEDCALLAFTGPAAAPVWMEGSAIDDLLAAAPAGNVDPIVATTMLRETIEAREAWGDQLAASAHERADELLDAHQRVRAAARQRGVRFRVEPQLPPDTLGLYLYLPVVRR